MHKLLRVLIHPPPPQSPHLTTCINHCVLMLHFRRGAPGALLSLSSEVFLGTSVLSPRMPNSPLPSIAAHKHQGGQVRPKQALQALRVNTDAQPLLLGSASSTHQVLRHMWGCCGMYHVCIIPVISGAACAQHVCPFLLLNWGSSFLCLL